MTEENDSVAIIIEILWSGRSCFDVYEVAWPHDGVEPTPRTITAAMTDDDGLQLVGGGILAWDDSQAVAMVVRLKDETPEPKAVEPTEIPPGPAL